MNFFRKKLTNTDRLILIGTGLSVWTLGIGPTIIAGTLLYLNKETVGASAWILLTKIKQYAKLK